MLRRRTNPALFTLCLTFLLPAHAWAMSDLCKYYRDSSPDVYKVFCKNGSGSSKPAGANSTFSDSFNISSASLPTEPSSYGLETLGSVIRNGKGIWSPTFALVKGFHKFGAGISTGSNNTFYGNDIVQRLKGVPEIDSFSPHEPSKGSISNLNIGTSILLHEASEGPTYRLGLSARYNKTSATWGGGPALLVSWKRFTLGAGFTRETISNFLPRMTFTSFIASARFSLFEFEYNLLSEKSGLPLSPIAIFTVTATYGRLTVSGAARTLDYFGMNPITQYHYAIQYLFSQRFSAGFLMNYIPGTNTIGIQYYL